jgi:diguanylate cyclase (GGDEF)-like protein
MNPATPDGIALAKARRRWPVVAATVSLLLLLGALAATIAGSQSSARSQIRSSFALRSKASAGFVATYLAEQGKLERTSAERFLASPRVDAHNLEVVATTLGSSASIVLDDAGRVVAAHPSTPELRGTALVAAYSNLPAVGQGRLAVSGLFYSPMSGAGSTAVTVPYASASGRRMLSVDYPTSNLGLNALVDRTISYPQHGVYLVDSTGRIVTSSPRTDAVTLARANPALARASSRASAGAVRGRTPSTFTSAPVPGTPWRLLIEVPNWKLFASGGDWTEYVPWLVFALVAMLGALLVLLFARSLSDRAHLTELSARMHRTAQTDSLTGLANRRALTEQLTRAGAHARRHELPLSVLMIDLDRFKQTNDTFGHEAGDQVLCTVADCMRDALRADDVYGRWGGDEFLVALPSTDADGAEATAERLREAAAAATLDSIGLPDGVPLSVGVATGVHTAPIELVREADAALYRAKLGRRREEGVLAAR